MMEKVSALIQFLAVISAVVLVWLGVGGAYNEYFGAEHVSALIVTTRLLMIAVGIGIGLVGVFFGKLLNFISGLLKR